MCQVPKAMFIEKGEFPQKNISVLLLGISLTILFYWVDPIVFLEKVGYATLAVLSIIELSDLVTQRLSKRR
jgi:hypothetical protein